MAADSPVSSSDYEDSTGRTQPLGDMEMLRLATAGSVDDG